jgi:hypothetical protein
LDGFAVPALHDRGTEDRLAGQRVAFHPYGYAEGSLAAPTGTMRLPLAVGARRTFHLTVGGETRLWDVEARDHRPVRATRRWEDLPLARE